MLEVRSRAMQESMPVGTGGMAAIIGKSMLEVEDLLDSIKDYGQISIANDNADGQIVVKQVTLILMFNCLVGPYLMKPMKIAVLAREGVK